MFDRVKTYLIMDRSMLERSIMNAEEVIENEKISIEKNKSVIREINDAINILESTPTGGQY